MIAPAVTPAEPTLDPDAGRAYLLRASLSGATLLMVILSWPLWIDLADFPAVPLVRWFPDYPRAWSWLGLVLLVAGLGMGVTRRFSRVGIGLAVVVLSWLILGDQLRLQPWVSQFLVMGGLCLALSPRRAMEFSRIYLASFYFYSGLSKLDLAFATEMGPQLLGAVARLLRLRPSVFGPPPIEMSYAMPAAEMVIAFLLLLRRTRLAGFIGLLALHASLLLILGPWPWGLGHSTIVLVWNVALAAEETILFWPARDRTAVPSPWSKREWIVALPMGLILALPLAEPYGYFDAWPSHALYASHCERSEIYGDEAMLESLPGSIRRLVVAKGWTSSRYWEFFPTEWTLLIRGVPSYPQRRYANGLAEWIVARGKPRRSHYNHASVVHFTRADRLTNRRASEVYSGLREIRDAGDRFWFNAHPRDR